MYYLVPRHVSNVAVQVCFDRHIDADGDDDDDDDDESI